MCLGGLDKAVCEIMQGDASPPPRTVRITALPPSLIDSNHASVDDPPSTQTGTKEKGKERAKRKE